MILKTHRPQDKAALLEPQRGPDRVPDAAP